MQAGTNYLYIIFAVVYVIYSIIKAGKKVTNNRPTVTPTPASQQEPSYTSQKKDDYTPVQPPTAPAFPEPSPGDDFRKMLEDLMGGGSTESPDPNPTMQPVANKTTPQKKQTVYHSMDHPKIISHSFDKAKTTTTHAKPAAEKPKLVSKKVVTEPVLEERAEIDFDVRQAVIFSEILKRPEY